ncbi:MAG: hypothetical protein PHO02_02025 [Candidatus Nanoarchaeia archaeon]|nr:hypothetical protein [Candidatus Nanoarchaeia archaeon]
MAKYDIFLDELGKIKDIDIWQFTLSALEAVDDKFYTEPASSSGKYHPPEDNGIGGLVRHVKKGVIVVEEFARRALFSDMEKDISISAFLLHDSCKDGVVWKGHTDYTHGYIAYEWLQQFKLEDAFAKEVLTSAVRFHMAPWVYRHPPFSQDTFTKKEMLENMEEMQRALTNPSRVELAVQHADYWSSRKEMSYLPGAKIVAVHDMTPEDMAKCSPEVLAKRYGLAVENGVLVPSKPQ